MSIEDDKAAARRAAFARRRAAHAALAGSEAEAAACAALADEILAAAPRVVSGYMPIRAEIDPIPAMTALAARGLRLCVPVIAGAGLPLRFREWTPQAEMTEGPFGACVPAAGDWLTPEALIVPLVAFDAALARLGYGGGFYDRTLAALRARGPVRAVGFAFAAQRADAPLPRERTDQPLDAVVTEQGVLRAPGGA